MMDGRLDNHLLKYLLDSDTHTDHNDKENNKHSVSQYFFCYSIQ